MKPWKMLVLSLIVGAFLAADSVAGEIHNAVREGNLEKVKALVALDRSLLEVKDTDGSRPLHVAALSGNLEMLKLLLEMGADLNSGDNENSNALHCAAIAGSAPIVDLLLSRGMNVNVQDNNGLTPLLFAVYRNREDVVKQLLAKGADPEVMTRNGEWALGAAFFRNKPRMAEILIAGGADVNAKNQEGATALYGAIGRGNLDMVRLLLQKGCNPNVGYNNGLLPLHLTAYRGDAEAVRLLLDAGAAVDPKEVETGETPLMNAVSQGNTEVVDLLLQRGADYGATQLKTGAALLHIAAARGYGAVADLLMSKGADVDAVDRDGNTPLFYAVKHGNTGIAKKLEARGARSKGVKGLESNAARLKKPLGDGEARVYYLGHAGWAVETKNNVLVFDYYRWGKPSDEPGLINGSITPEELGGKKVTVFVSHNHSDHFDRSILGWNGRIKDLTYVFGEKPDTTFAYELMGPRESRVINGIDVSTIKSTDAGVAFFVAVDGVTIYHGGDHANKNDDLSGPFGPEIDYLADKAQSVDIAFVPVCGCGFPELSCVRKGIYYSVEKLNPKALFPMHSAGAEYRYAEFAQDAKANNCRAGIYCAKAGGDRYLYRRGRVKEL